MTQWLMGHLDGAGIAQIMAGDPAAQAQLDAAPPFIKDALLFPYLQGVTFVSAIWAQGGWPAVDRVFSRLPGLDRADPPRRTSTRPTSSR